MRGRTLIHMKKKLKGAGRLVIVPAPWCALSNGVINRIVVDGPECGTYSGLLGTDETVRGESSREPYRLLWTRPSCRMSVAP